jgi:hypothetical protein
VGAHDPRPAEVLAQGLVQPAQGPARARIRRESPTLPFLARAPVDLLGDELRPARPSQLQAGGQGVDLAGNASAPSLIDVSVPPPAKGRQADVDKPGGEDQ